MAITARVARRLIDDFLYAEETGITGLKREVAQSQTRTRRTPRPSIATPGAVVLEQLDLDGYSIPLTERNEIRRALAFNAYDHRLIKSNRQALAVTLLMQIKREGVGFLNNEHSEVLRDVVMMHPVVNGAWMRPEEHKQVMEAIIRNDRETVEAVSHTVSRRRQERRERRVQNG